MPVQGAREDASISPASPSGASSNCSSGPSHSAARLPSVEARHAVSGNDDAELPPRHRTRRGLTAEDANAWRGLDSSQAAVGKSTVRRSCCVSHGGALPSVS